MNDIYNELKYVIDNSNYVKINYKKLNKFIEKIDKLT